MDADWQMKTVGNRPSGHMGQPGLAEDKRELGKGMVKS